MNIQFVRLEADVCGRLNDMARDSRRTVSDLVNEILRLHLNLSQGAPKEDHTAQ